MPFHAIHPHFTEPTTQYWQQILPADALSPAQLAPPWRHAYPAQLPDGRYLMLPIRQFAADPSRATASLICNQASLSVADELSALLAKQLAPLRAEVIIGLPTLGLTFAPLVARELGHDRYIPMGYSRKFWYDETLSGAVHSITSPLPGKKVYLDPNLLPLVTGKRIILIDDAVSSGNTIQPPWNLIESLGAEVLACGVVMRQSRRWATHLGAERAARIVSVFDSPLLRAEPQGWVLEEQ